MNVVSNASWGYGLNPYPQSTMNSKLVFGGSHDIFTVGNKLNSISLEGLIYGDWEQFTSSCMAYPFTIQAEAAEGTYYLTASGISFPDITCKGYLNTNAAIGAFNLGEYKYPKCSTFMDFEPYTNADIFLPYYGFVPLKIADVDDKYIQFRLNIDWSTGQATYTVSVSDTAVNDTEKLPYIDLTKQNQYKACRPIIIKTFQLGYSIPISTVNFNNTIRNMANMAISVGSAMLGAAYAGSVPSVTSTATHTMSVGKKPSTGELAHVDISNTRNVTERTHSGSIYNTAITTASSVLNNLAVRGDSDKPNNICMLGCVGRSVAIVTRKVNPTVDINSDEHYKHLTGVPLGVCATIGGLKGYTTITSMHTDGVAATSDELDMIVNTLQSGVIL